MTENPIKQIRREMMTFLFLAVVNIVFSAIALATGIVFIVNHLPAAWDNFSNGAHLLYLVTGFPLALIGLFWIVYSVGLMDFITDKQFEFIKTESEDQAEFTRIIIAMLSYYRHNNTKIKRMIFISRLGGVIFLFNAAISCLDFLFNYSSFSSIRPMQMTALILVFVWGIASLVIPVFVKKFSYIWDLRLQQSKQAEDSIAQLMGSTQDEES